MATGKITVAAPNRKGVVGRQQEAYNRSLERTAQYSERSDNRATDAAQKAYDRAAQFQFENISRVVQQTDAANEKFLRSRLDQFTEVRNFENQQFQRNEQLAISQRKEQRETAFEIRKSLNKYNQGVRAQNLESLATISETANSIVETAYKRHVEGITREEFATGVAEGSSFGITPEQLQTVSLAQRGLVKAATDEGVANDALFEVDAIQGEDQRRSSPALTGHRAYARARGRAQAARGNWATALDVWINSEAALIPDPENPGQLISPRALARKGPAGTMAALQAGNAFLTEKFGLGGVNPAIIAEELSETVTGVTASIARNIITQDRAIDKQNQIEEVTDRLTTSYRGVGWNDAFDVTRFFNTQVDMLSPLVGGRGKANDIVVDQLLRIAVTDRENGLNIIAGLEVADKSLTDPSLGRIGDGKYAPLFQEAAEQIAKQEVVEEQALQVKTEELLARVENDHRGDIAEAGADPNAVEQAHKSYRQRLFGIAQATNNEKAWARFQEENLKPLTYTDQGYSIKLEIFQKTGHIDSDADLQDAVDKGMMTAAQARDLAQRRGVDAGGEIVKDMHPEIKSITNKVFVEDIVQAAGINTIQKLGAFGQVATSTLADETALHVQNWINGQPAGSVTTAGIRAEALRYAKQAVKDRNYQIQTKEGALSPSEKLAGKKPEIIFEGPVGDPANRITISAPNPRSPSKRSFDLRGKRPEVINGFMTANDVVLNDQEIDAAIEALKTGAPMPSRVSGISQSTGIPAAEIVSRQDNLNRGGQGLGADPFDPFMSNPQAAQAASIIPREGALMIHPNVPQARISRSRQLVEQRRNITMQRAANQREQERLAQLRTAGQDLTDPPVNWTQGQVGARTATNAVKPLLDLLAEGESESSGGYDAVAGSRTGIAGLSNMTFGQARAQAGNNAIGRYQFIPGTMEAALKAAGMSMNDKFSPENQDRLATAWILNGQRKALSAYITGKSDNLSAAVNDAAYEWAALSLMTGAGKYDNDGRNKATISSGRVAQTLQQVRRAYLDSRSSQSGSTGSTGFQMTNTLRTLGGQIKYSSEKDANGRVIPSRCTTNVLKTLELNGIPNPDATGNDWNNPRGAASQFINKFGWKSLNIPGSRPITLDSTYGKAAVNQMSLQQYKQAVGQGRIPSGALVFQTRHSSWNANTGSSYGFDIAIARNGGSQLFNGEYKPSAMYGPSTTHVFVLVPSN